MRKNLQQYRQQQGFTQAQIAELLDIGEEMYRHMEAGRRTGKITRWIMLSELFSVPISQLIEQAKQI